MILSLDLVCVLYRVWKKVFARLPTVSWFGVCKDFLPHVYVYIYQPLYQMC